MTLEPRIKELVDKVNRKLEKDEEVRKEVQEIKKTFNIILDDGAESYSFKMENAAIVDFATEALPTADVSLETSSENMVKLMDGELRPMKAYITKKVKIKGKFQDLMFLKKFF